MDCINLAQTLVDVTDRDETDSVMSEEGQSGESGRLLATVLTGSRAEAPEENLGSEWLHPKVETSLT